MEEPNVFTKLVRDKVPEIIASNGGNDFEIETVSGPAFIEALSRKLIEECNELFDVQEREQKIEDLADIVEVVYAFASELDVTPEEIERIRLEKREKRGGFDKKILLKSTKTA